MEYETISISKIDPEVDANDSLCEIKITDQKVKQELYKETRKRELPKSNSQYSTIDVDESLLENRVPEQYNTKQNVLPKVEPKRIRFDVPIENTLKILDGINTVAVILTGLFCFVALFRMITGYQGGSPSGLIDELSESSVYLFVCGVPVIVGVLKPSWKTQHTIRMIVLNAAAILVASVVIFPAFNSPSFPKKDLADVSSNDKVYITLYGEKFHSSENCPGLSNAGEILEKSFQSASENYDSCSLCWK